MENNSKGRFAETAVRILAVFGFVAIILIGLWGSVSVAKVIPGTFASLASAIVSLTSVFVPANNAITISVPSLTVNDGEAFALSWTHESTQNGSYKFRYDCVPGVSFTSPTRTGSEAAIFCNTPFNFLNATDSITVTAFSEENQLTDVGVHIDFIPEGSTQAAVTGSVTLTVNNNEEQTTTPNTPNTNTGTRNPGTETSSTFPISGGQTASNPNGFVDLTVAVIAVGVVDKDTGTFTASSTPTRDSSQYRVAARFAVTNIGTKTSDQWNFNAVLPTFPSHIFTSPNQQALGPGDRIEFTIGFDSFDQDGVGDLVINIDPSGRMNESNKTNNILHYTITTNK